MNKILLLLLLSFVILSAIFILILPPQNVSNELNASDMKLILMDKSSQAVCLDGSPTGYYFAPGHG